MVLLWRCFREESDLLPERLKLHLLLNIQVLGPPQLHAQVLALFRMPLALEVAEAEACLRLPWSGRISSCS